MIFTGFSPNTTSKDVKTVLKGLFIYNLKNLYNGEHQNKLRLLLSKIYNDKAIYLTDSGRSALSLALRSANIKSGDEVIVQGFTCVVVTNAILSVGATPIFVDVDDRYCTDPKEVSKKITKKTKAIIVQHSFGFAADIRELKQISQKNNIILIEDCAHALAAKTSSGEVLGSFGDMSIISFGVDKVISSVRGGALIVNNQELVSNIDTRYEVLEYKNITNLFRHLANILIFSISKPLYNIYIGKIILYISKKLNITNKIITSKEKNGEISYNVFKLENILAHLAYDQLLNIDNNIKNRKQLAKIYYDELKDISQISMPKFDSNSVYLRFPIHIANPDKLHAYAKNRGIILGNWYNTVVAPSDCNISKIYTPNDCPKAESFSKTIINLPTNINITKQDQNKIIEVIKNYVNTI